MTSHGSRDFDSAKRSRSTQIANLTKLYKKLEENMSSYENYENVKQLNNRLCKNFETLKCVHQECVSLCTDSVMCEDVSKSFESSPKNFDEFQERLSQWLVAYEKASDDEDMISSVSRASTTASSRSNLRSARAKRLLTEHKLRTLREKHRLEQERRVLEHKRQLLEHESEVEEARIEEAIWEEEKEEGITTIGDVMVRSSGADQMSGDLTVRSGEAHRMSGDLTVRSGGAHRMSGDLTVRSGGADQKFGDFTLRSGGADRTSGDLTVRTGGSGRLSGDLSMRYSGVDWKSGDVTVRSREDVPEVVHHGQNILPDDVCNIREGSDISRPYSVTHNVTSGNRDLPMAAAEARSDKTEHMLYIDSAFHRIASTLQEGFNLPKPEIFSGKAIDYCKFIRNFETNIESKINDDRIRLSYLIQYCTGDARKCIEDCVLLEYSEGYWKARSILQNRYGKPHVIARSHIDKLVTGPQIKATDFEGLSHMSLEMQKCEITLSQLGFVSDVDNSENLRKIVKRLPMHLRTKWVDVAHDILESGREPCFSDLVKFVVKRSHVACSMYGTDHATDNSLFKSDKPKYKHDAYVKSKVTTLTTNTHKHDRQYDRKCLCCSGSCTDLSSCKSFQSMNLEIRRKFVRKSKLCFNCFKGNHMSNNCRKPKQCSVPDCSQKHQTMLHSWAKSDLDYTVTQPSVNYASTSGCFVKTCLAIIPVTVIGSEDQSCQTYAFLDDGVDKTLCDERLLQTLNVSSRPVTFQISTINSTGSTTIGREVDMRVRNVMGIGEVSLKNVWSVKRLPISIKSAASAKDISRFHYLADLNIPSVGAGDVMLLIGTDAPEANIPLDVRTGEQNQPYAVRSRLGWMVRGPVRSTTDTHIGNDVNINFSQSHGVLLQQQLERMWTTYFNDVIHCEKGSFSVEDKRALQIMESTLSKENGHYKMGLPWRDENTSLPYNLMLAHARLVQLKKRLSRDSELHKKYADTLKDYIDKRYAKEVTETDTTNRTWYLPHHPVINENKPEKVRVVFDCAAKFQGPSLNSQLLQGPDFVNSLVGVLCRFRQERVAIVADIEAMFHQVRVCEHDCQALRFLWWPGGDISATPKTFSMQVHLGRRLHPAARH